MLFNRCEHKWSHPELIPIDLWDKVRGRHELVRQCERCKKYAVAEKPYNARERI